MHRRFFLKSGALAFLSFGLTPAFLWRTARAEAKRRSKTLVCIFQRGAVDGLNMVVPFAESAYYRMRNRIAIPQPGPRDGAALDLDGSFGFHPALAGLKPLYDRGLAAVVQAVGSPSATRSHFDAQYYMETAVPNAKSVQDGWLNRVLAVSGRCCDPEGHVFLRALAHGERMPVALKGAERALALASLDSFLGEEGQRIELLAALYDEESEDLIVGGAGRDAIEAVRLLRANDPRRYAPRTAYPNSAFGRSLKEIAQLIKADLGLEIAFTDVGGWDTHVNQGGSQGQLATRLRDFADAITAFCEDLGDRLEEVLVLTMSEFGRTVRENGNAGTDHGHANCLFLIGGGVRGGELYGEWPGLEPEQLYEGRDLALTTDFRDVFAEVLSGHLGIVDLASVFPGHIVSAARFRGFLA